MHRDEAIYARSDARGGITLTAEEAARVLRWASSYEDQDPFWDASDDAIVTRLEAAR